ncbi:hypothetical protein COL40_30545 [Bacillus toyonensis]|nr:hypothetical protein COL40_30545 [Bacillus toyonensis]PHC04204.1 hypothetical protein COE97_30505 [Bacillus toyonensis]
MRSISYIKGPKQSERNGKVGGHKAYEAIRIMIGRTMMRWVSINNILYCAIAENKRVCISYQIQSMFRMGES